MNNNTHQFCTFFIDSLYIGIDVNEVQEVIRYQAMTRTPRAPSVVSGLINLRGQIVTALDLRVSLGIKQREPDEQPMNIVVRDGENVISFLVDRIGDVVEADDSIFEPPPLTLPKSLKPLVKGAYKYPSQLLLVLNTERALTESHSEHPTKSHRRSDSNYSCQYA